MMLASLCLALTFVPLLIGWLHDNFADGEKHGYYEVSLLYVVFTVVGFVITIIMKLEDRKTGNRLRNVMKSE